MKRYIPCRYVVFCLLRCLRWKSILIFLLGLGFLTFLLYQKLSSLDADSMKVTFSEKELPPFLFRVCPSDMYWQRRMSLDHHDVMRIRWNVTDTHLIMMVIGKTKGWIGLGFSPNGTMVEADMMIGWVKDGQVYLEDRYANMNGRPVLDDHKDYELICGSETDSHTTLVFMRKLNTCDKQDFKIKDFTNRIIWAFNEEDPIIPGYDGPNYHGNKRGSNSLFLLDAKHAKPLKNETQTFDVLIGNVPISTNLETVTWCYPLEIPAVYQSSQLVGYEPIVQDPFKGTVHHMLLYFCSISKTDRNTLPKFLTPIDCFDFTTYSLLICSDTLLTWVMGSEGEFYPSNVGYTFRNVEDRLSYFRLEVHYNNAHRLSGVDNSGIRLYMSTKPREYEAGILSLGNDISPYEIIPPSLHQFKTTAVCPKFCLESEEFPSNGIRVFGLLNHAHSAKKIILKRIRNGVELEPIMDEHYDSTYQQAWFFKNEIEILPGDSLLVECIYDTSDAEYTRTGGLTHTHEMCLIYLQYYPLIPLYMCKSTITPDTLHQLIGIKKINTSNYYILDPEFDPPIDLATFLSSYKWTDEQKNALQLMNNFGPFTSGCYFKNQMTKFYEGGIYDLRNSQSFQKKQECW